MIEYIVHAGTEGAQDMGQVLEIDGGKVEVVTLVQEGDGKHGVRTGEK